MNIVGLGPSHDKVPWQEETWGLPWDAWSPRYELLFEMHSRPLFETRGEKYIERLKESDVPIYMQEEHPDIPMSRRFPLEEVSEIIGDYYGSSIAYMLGLAILQGKKEIGIYGVDLSEDIYDHQRPNLEYIIGIAKGKGINVTVPGESMLLRRETKDEFNGLGVIYRKRYGWL